MKPIDALRLFKPAAVAGPAPTRVTGGTGNGTATTSGTVNIDISGFAGIQAGDVIIFAFCQGNPNTNQDMSGVGNNSGAMIECADLYANDTNDTNLWVGMAVQGATVDTSITINGLSTALSAAFVWAASIWRGVNNTTPNDVAPVTTSGIDGDTANPAAITPVTTNAWLVAVYASSQGTSTAWTAPGDVSNFDQIASGKARLAMADTAWTGGTFDAAPVGGGTAASTDSRASCVMALRPA